MSYRKALLLFRVVSPDNGAAGDIPIIRPFYRLAFRLAVDCEV